MDREHDARVLVASEMQGGPGSMLEMKVIRRPNELEVVTRNSRNS